MVVLIKKARTFCHDGEGPTAIEYAVFLALIVFAYWAVMTLIAH